jgi:hypothetical protein
MPLGDWQYVPAQNLERGLALGPRSATTRWAGERMDYGLGVDSLLYKWSLLTAAAEILAFGVIVNNCDRLTLNPNCMFDGKSLAIFDHELAFPSALLGWRPPWEQGALNDVTQGPGRHLFCDPLRGKNRPRAVRRCNASCIRQSIEAVRRGVTARMAGSERRAFAKDDEIDFQHAWKNGAWHCLEPVSFDLLRADSIREKAHKVLGELTSLRDATEPFKVPSRCIC